MPLSERGEGLLKFIIALAVLAALIFVGVKTIPVYFNNSQLADFIRERAIRATVERPAPDAVQAEVVHYAKELGVPITSDNVQVTFEAGIDQVKINVDYTVPVDLKVYTWNMHFTPSAVSRGY